MSLIKIYANNIELDIVKDTLTIVKENNALTQDFKVSYSDFPFMIIENENTKIALGTRDITSINKKKIVDVVIEELGQKFHGQLQTLSFESGFRKVTLKYGTELLTIMSKKIADFMPVISVIPPSILATTGGIVPFTEESPNVIPGSDWWFSWATYIPVQDFPSTRFQLPMMEWKNKYENDAAWSGYTNFVNAYSTNTAGAFLYLPNYYNNTGNVISVWHRNVPMPQIYLLSPLLYAMESIGWKMEGDFVNDNFVKRLLMLSQKNNLCKTTVTLLPDAINFALQPNYNNNWKEDYIIPSDGKYIISWNFELNDGGNTWQPRTQVFVTRGPWYFAYLFANNSNTQVQIFSGSVEVDAAAGDFLQFHYKNIFQHLPVSYSLTIVKKDETATFYECHPTIELGRYCPDWDFGTYLNEMKKFFNLKIDIDDLNKTINFNYNEDIIEISEKVIIDKLLIISNNELQEFEAFHLKYQNESDTALWITRNLAQNFTTQTSDFVEVIESKFKFVPSNGFTAQLSEDLDSKDGVGLMIYDSTFKPNILNNYQNQNLKIEGPNGIYETYFKKWLKFKLNASHIEMTGYFTEIELSKISKVERIYIDHQEYNVASLEYSETEQSNFEVLLKLKSVNF